MVTSLILTLFKMYYMLIFVRIIISWFPIDQYNDWVKMLSRLTDPYLDLFRKFIPPMGMMDISPVVALFALDLIKNVLLILVSSLGI